MRLLTTTLRFGNHADWQAAADPLRDARYGVIETSEGQLRAIHFRPWPKLISWPEFWPAGKGYHMPGPPDRCLLYYNQPRAHSNFLALKYVVSSRRTSYRTVRAAGEVLDAIAELKSTDAILCDAGNSRLSDRMMQRLGWQSHKPQRWHRNYIKRFYGSFPKVRIPVEVADGDDSQFSK